MLIKVCGMRQADNIRAVEQAGADWLGFIFYPRSPRFVDEVPAYLPQRGVRVGVFVHPDSDEVGRRVRQFGLQAVQLHGKVHPDLCRALRQCGLTVVRALPVTPSFVSEAAAYVGAVDYFLFDTPTQSFGGSGCTYDWSLLARYEAQVPFLLSGGLSPSSVEALHTFSHPQLAGYDLNSGFELAPALKDVEAIRKFIKQITANEP